MGEGGKEGGERKEGGKQKKKNSVRVGCPPEEQEQEKAKLLELATHQPLRP